MPDESLPPANLILQALHGIRSDLLRLDGGLKTIQELQGATNDGLVRLESRLERLERRTTEGFLETNTKLAALTQVVMEHDRRLDHLLTDGLGAEVRELRRRVDRIESGRVARLRKKKPTRA